jgi:hypothetical protein
MSGSRAISVSGEVYARLLDLAEARGVSISMFLTALVEVHYPEPASAEHAAPSAEPCDATLLDDDGTLVLT